MYMPKLHDLCQQFWEEITITRNHPQNYPPEFIIAQAHRYMAESERARAGAELDAAHTAREHSGYGSIRGK
ncbi:MAG: hypothetical protein ACR2PY_01920 [Salinispira sp.]